MIGRYASVPERITWTNGFQHSVDKAVLGALSTFADFESGRGARMSLDGLIARAGLPRRTVERALQRLEADGWIVGQRRHRHATLWAITVSRLATNWVGATLASDKNLSATGGGQSPGNPDLSATGGGQNPDLSATGGGPIPCSTDPQRTTARARATAGPEGEHDKKWHPSPQSVPRQLTLDVDLPAGDVWAAVLERIEAKVNRNTFYTWWKDTVLVEDCGAVLLVRAKNDKGTHDLTAHWIQKHFAVVLGEALAEVRPGARVVFEFAVKRPQARTA